MYRLFRFRSQINNGCPRMVPIDSYLISNSTVTYSYRPGHLHNVKLSVRYRSNTSEGIQSKNVSKIKQFKKRVKPFAEVVQVTNGITSQSKVKVKHLKPNQVHKMVVCKKPLAMFPKTIKQRDPSAITSDTKNKMIVDKKCFKEELLDDLDELNEDQINLLKDTELLQTITMTENDLERKVGSVLKKEDQELVEVYNSFDSSINQDKLPKKKNSNKLLLPKTN